MPVDTSSNPPVTGIDLADGLRHQQLDRRGNPSATTILFVAAPTAYGGTEKALLELIRRLRGPANISVLCIGPDVFSERLNWSGADKIRVRREALPHSFWGWFRLFSRNRADVVVFIHNWLDAFPWDAPVAARLAGIRRSVAIQQLLAPPLHVAAPTTAASRLLRRLTGARRPWFVRRRLSSSVARTTTICVSDAVRERLVTMYGFSPDGIITVHNGVDASEFVPNPAVRRDVRAKLGLDPSDFVFIFTGRLSHQKGVDVLLNAMSKALRDGARCKCLIVGEGPLMEKLTEQASRLGLTNSVFFLGFQNDPRPFLQAADAFILTSHFEGLPLSVVEAMACGLPCVVTDAGGNAEAVVDRGNGLVVPPSAVDETSAAMSYLMANPSETARMAKESRTRATGMFDLDELTRRIERVLTSNDH
jgi:glycosyltransferase involved in cell wall biosynthesis